MNKLMDWILRAFRAFDWPLLLILVIFCILGMTVMHSAVGDTDWRFASQARNFLLAFVVMWVVAMIPPSRIMKFAIPFYVIGVLMLVAVLLVLIITGPLLAGLIVNITDQVLNNFPAWSR